MLSLATLAWHVHMLWRCADVLKATMGCHVRTVPLDTHAHSQAYTLAHVYLVTAVAVLKNVTPKLENAQ